jgi:hypothetical protein
VLIESWASGSMSVLRPLRKRAAASKQVKAWRETTADSSCALTQMVGLYGIFTWLHSLEPGLACPIFCAALPFNAAGLLPAVFTGDLQLGTRGTHVSNNGRRDNRTTTRPVVCSRHAHVGPMRRRRLGLLVT